MGVSKAQARATVKYENKAYFKSLVRFKKEDEERIRAAAGDSLNGCNGKSAGDRRGESSSPHKLRRMPILNS